MRDIECVKKKNIQKGVLKQKLGLTQMKLN